MARPTKEGLDYFPMDVDFDQDDKLVVPIANHGMLGLGIIVKIMSEIYRNGYFYPWGKREQVVFPKKINVDINTIMSVINDCIEWGFFSQKIFEDHGILTSAGFQKRYIEAAKRRKELTFIREYTLIDLEKACRKVSFPINEVDVNGNIVNVHINPVKADNMSAEDTQSKVKESKVKESKEKVNIKDLSAEIENFRSRYSDETKKLIDQYLDFIRETRTTKKIADSVIHKIMTYFDKYSPIQVEYAIRQHMSIEAKKSAKEEYTFGIIRNSTEEEAAKKLSQLREGRKKKKAFDKEAFLASLSEE